MRKPIFGGNWKMHKTVKEAVYTVEDLKEEIGNIEGVEVVVFPPFTALNAVKTVLEETQIGLGAQNMYWEEKGAYTGEISPLMLLEAGCKYVILGHSERRGYFGETNLRINKKLKVALGLGLIPVVCVGERLEERKKGKAKEVVVTQLRECLEKVNSPEVQRLVIAYEPVWAIGTGETATPRQAQEMHQFIRGILLELLGEGLAASIRIQYGGSVKPENIKDLIRQPDIDGALVGGASLEARSFARIIRYKDKNPLRNI